MQSATAWRSGRCLGLPGVGDDPGDDRAGVGPFGEDGGAFDDLAPRLVGPREPRDDRADGLVVDAQTLVEAVNCVAAYTGLSMMICTLAPAVEAQSTR